MKGDAGTLQARAACLHAALMTRTVGDGPADVIARAETYWAWVQQPPPDAADKGPKAPR